MSKIISINQLLEMAQKYAIDCADTYSTVKKIRFNDHGCLITPTKESNYTASMQGMPNDHAMSQIVERLDAPRLDWLNNPKRCPVLLKAKILNNLARDYRPDDGLFIRYKGETVRGFLSRYYTKFDNVPFIGMVSDALSTMGVDCQVHRAEVGDVLSAYILIPSITFDHDPAYRNPNGGSNGGLHPAIYVGNNEVGQGTARSAGALFRDFCANGAIYGWQQDETLSIRHRYLTESVMKAIVADGIAVALRMSKECAEAYVEAQSLQVQAQSLKGIIGEWASKYGLSIDAKENWLKAVTNEASDNDRPTDIRLIDLFNGATSASQHVENIQAREMQERMAGDLLHHFTHHSREL